MTKTRRHGFPARTARSASDLGRIALSFRRQFCPELADDEAFHGIDVFEQLCNRSVMFKGQRVPIDTDVMPLPRSVEAVTFFDARNEEFRMCLSETTYVGLEMGDARARFTFSHELGHLCCHRHEMVTLRALPPLDRMMAREVATHPYYLDTEWQANAFGARLLMPDEGLSVLEASGRLCEKGIVHAFGVSAAAARTRLEQFLREKERP